MTCHKWQSVALSIAVAAWSGSARYTLAQQPLRSGVELVELDVIVLDKDRRQVRGLTQRDFTIVENGHVRPVLGFAAVDAPTPGSPDGLSAGLGSSGGVVTNNRADRGRLVVIVFDRSIPVGAPTIVAQTIARSAVDALGPRDLGAVVRTSSFANEGKTQNFTRDRRLLLDAINSAFIGLVSPPIMQPGGLRAAQPDLQLTGDCVCGLCTLEALERIANALAPVHSHQKVVLFIASDVVVSDGVGTYDQCRGRVRVAREAAFRALDRANVTVHSIDPVGLESLTSGVGAVERRFDTVRASTQARLGNLAVLPSYTGGRLVRNTNAPGQIVPEILAETASYYLLGFERGTAVADAPQRAVKVRVNRPGVTVVARKAYYPASPASKSVATDPLADTISGVLPVSDIAMALSLGSVFTTSGQVRTNVLIGMSDTSARSGGGTTPAPDANGHGPETRFDVMLGVFDDRANTILTRKEQLEARGGSCADGWCQSISQLELTPGRYEIRVGVLDRGSAKRGSVYGYVDVPALRPDTFLLSDLQIHARDLTGASVAPTLSRTFSHRERLAIFTQVRRPLDSTAPVTIRATVADSQARTVVQSSNVLDAASFSGSAVSEIRIDQALAKLEPGAYVLTIEARHLERSVQRSVSFEVQ